MAMETASLGPGASLVDAHAQGAARHIVDVTSDETDVAELLVAERGQMVQRAPIVEISDHV